MTTGIGKRIRDRRKELGLSQEELAARMNLKSKSTICKVERGDDNMTSTTIEQYAKALNTTPAYIMGWEDSEEIAEIRQRIVNEYVQNDKARQMFELYKQAPPEIQAAVEILLKSRQSDS